MDDQVLDFALMTIHSPLLSGLLLARCICIDPILSGLVIQQLDTCLLFVKDNVVRLLVSRVDFLNCRRESFTEHTHTQR